MPIGDVLSALWATAVANWYIVGPVILGLMGVAVFLWRRRRRKFGGPTRREGKTARDAQQETVEAIVWGRYQDRETVALESIADADSLTYRLLGGKPVVLLEELH